MSWRRCMCVSVCVFVMSWWPSEPLPQIEGYLFYVFRGTTGLWRIKSISVRNKLRQEQESVTLFLLLSLCVSDAALHCVCVCALIQAAWREQYRSFALRSLLLFIIRPLFLHLLSSSSTLHFTLGGSSRGEHLTKRKAPRSPSKTHIFSLCVKNIDTSFDAISPSSSAPHCRSKVSSSVLVFLEYVEKKKGWNPAVCVVVAALLLYTVRLISFHSVHSG